MKRAIGLSVVLMLGCATGAVMRDLVVPARAQNQVGPNYEYVSVKVEGPYEQAEIDKATSEHGKQGWRLASAFARSASVTFLIFERQIAR